MENQNYTFSSFHEYTSKGISSALRTLNVKNKQPVILCIGSDLVLSDSLGPLIGTLLLNKNINAHVYGSLTFPVTAKEVNYAKSYLKSTYEKGLIIAVDAAVGSPDDIGLIRVLNRGIKPGLGVGKNLNTIGDLSIIGIVAEKNYKNEKMLNATRLNLIYKMAEQIALGIEDYLLAN